MKVALRQRRVVIIQLQAALCARPHQALQRKVVTAAITLYTHWMSLTMRKESEEPHHHLSGIKVREVITKPQATSWSHPHQALQISHVLY
uniref:Putative secreted protein n=1 Tax=Ixodes ricinus TaxID=34613 RepID=A0A6B0U701_IXORI